MNDFAQARSYVPPCGSLKASIVIVADQPVGGQRKKLFDGTTGRLFSSLMQTAGISLAFTWQSAVVTNTDKPRSAFFVPASKGVAPHFTAHGQAHVDNLFASLHELKNKKVIIACGDMATFALTGWFGVNKWQGSIHWNEVLQCYVVPTIHPVTIVRETMAKDEKKGHGFPQRFVNIMWYKRANLLASGKYQWTDYVLHVAPTFNQVMEFLAKVKQKGLAGKHIGYDIETLGTGSNMWVACYSFSVDRESMCIPLIGFNHVGPYDYFTLDEERQILIATAEILESEKILKIAHNAVFDIEYTGWAFGIHGKNFHCTMVAQRMLFYDMLSGLDMTTRMFTDIPYYKEDGKDFIGGGQKLTQESVAWRYNALDSLVCDIAYPKMLAEIKKLGNLEIYQNQCAQIEALVTCSMQGVLVDEDRMEKLRNKLQIKADAFKQQVIELVEMPDLNVNSGPQLQEVFYKKFKVPVQISRSTGNPSINATVLGKIKRKELSPVSDVASRAASLILDYRELAKKISTYLTGRKVSPDGRMRSTYDPAGTAFSRLASKGCITGYGMNMQNWPHDLKALMIPDPGYVVCEIDLSQAENRIVAWLANCLSMMQAFEDGLDVHGITTKLIMQYYYGTTDHGFSVKDMSPLGTGNHEWRFYGKRANHSGNYDIREQGFADKNEFSLEIAKIVLSAYHAGYPEIREVFHKNIRELVTKTRTTKNLMGRTIRFWGEMDSNLYRKAYNSIPQGTVGDIIIKHGILPMMSDPVLAPMELLMQVHDSVVVQMPLAIGYDGIAKCCFAMKNHLEQPLTIPSTGKSFVIPADFLFGYHCNKDDEDACFEIKAGKMPATEQGFAKILADRLPRLIG